MNEEIKKCIAEFRRLKVSWFPGWRLGQRRRDALYVDQTLKVLDYGCQLADEIERLQFKAACENAELKQRLYCPYCNCSECIKRHDV